MSYPYKTEHKEMSLHCNFLTIKHYYRKMKGACIQYCVKLIFNRL